MKKNFEIVIQDFCGKDMPLYSNQLGWSLEHKKEAVSSVSRKVFEYFVEKLQRNLIFYYVRDGNFYGIHSENCPTPVFRFKKDTSYPNIYDQLDGDTHNYEDGEILFLVPCEYKIWDVVKIDGKGLEEVLQNSFIVNIS